MLAPLLRSTITLVALVAAYQVYVLTVAPLVEPPAVKRSTGAMTDGERRESYQAIGRYQELLAAYFPADHWSLSPTKPPKVIRVDELMFVLSDYRRYDNGSIDLEQCVVLVLPKDWQFGSPPPTETVILEAPGGAHLQFDEEFQPARGKAGRIVEGKFPGPIVIRSDMKQPGPEDDLVITTHDLVMNEMLISTAAKVSAKLGANHGSGRRMDIRLSRDEHIKRGPSINGVQSLMIYEDVELELQASKSDLTGEQANPKDKVANRPLRLPATGRVQLVAAQQPVAPQAKSEFEPPVRVTCAGRFHFDLLNYVASFDQDVKVQRMRLEGTFDQLDCNELSIYFAALDDAGNPIANNDDPDVARKQRRAAGNFRPIALQAKGNPVRAESAVEQVSARAERLRIHLIDRRITLDGGREVMLAHAADEFHAPLIEYQMPPEDSPQAVGELSIAGPGWLRTIPDEKRPDRVIDIAWKQDEQTKFPVQIRRRRGQPVLMLTGSPVIDAHRLGKVKADRMELLLREVPSDGPNGPALEISRSSTKLAVIPERLLAAGQVQFAAPELIGRTHQLEADFEPWLPPEVLQAKPDAKQAAQSPLAARDERAGPKTQYDLTASQIHLDLSLTGQRAEPTAASCEGSVVLREVKAAKPGEAPLVVKGEKLQVREINKEAKITVTGRGNPGAGVIGGASVEAQGLTLTAERIDAEQETGKFWIAGPGRATMNVDGEMFGEIGGPKGGAQTPVTLTWQKGLNAAGQRIVVQGRVLVESQQGWAQGDSAVAHLTRPLAGDKTAGRGKIEVAQVSLEGNVAIDRRELDDQGQRSHENLQLHSIAYNRLTGDIQGVGPGVLRSVRLGDGKTGFANLAGAGRATATLAATSNSSSAGLRFLRIDFAQGLTGNSNQRVLRFHRRVLGVYGPVDGWQQELPLHSPDRLPPDTMTLGCETLVVNEDPQGRLGKATAGAAQFGPIELRAIDNVEIEGRSETHGVFQALGAAASYNQLKDLMVLEGNGQQDAVLRYRDAKTGQFIETPAGSIRYWRSAEHVTLDNVRSPLEFQQNEPRSATLPGSSR